MAAEIDPESQIQDDGSSDGSDELATESDENEINNDTDA
jgi:hypothetical protein